jgi:hypothetical protein
MKEFRKIPSLKFLYEIDSAGVIRNIKSKHVLKPFLSGGYYRVCIGNSANKANKKHYIHDLVAECWLGPKPAPEYEVDHIDRDKLNNDYHNLRWVTHSDNLKNRDYSNIHPPLNPQWYNSDANHDHMREIGKIHSEESKIRMRIFYGSFSRDFACAEDAATWVVSIKGCGSVRTIADNLRRVARGQRKQTHGYRASYIR